MGDVKMSGNGAHPSLLSYGSTDTSDLPLVMVVGREPNGTGAVSALWGRYDFLERLEGNRRAGSPFWDCAYALLGTASTPSIDTKGIKAIAAGRGISPVIFADALPHGIDNSIANKDSLRLAFSDESVKAHVAAVFKHEQFIKRVRLILLSGLSGSLARSAEFYETEGNRRGITVQRLPFFAGQNLPRIRREVREDVWAILRSIASDLAARSVKESA